MTNTTQKHTPQTIREAQNLASSLNHLNKGIASLTHLYESAPDLLESCRESLKTLTNLRSYYENHPEINFNGANDIGFRISNLKYVIEKAEGK